MSFAREADTVVVHSMNGLESSHGELRHRVQQLTERGIRVEFVKQCQTFTGEDSSMANLLLSVMAFAKFEPALIREWQREGIALVMQRGAYRGREKALADDQVVELRRRAGAGEQKVTSARKFGINRETLYQYLKLVPAP